MQEQKRLQASLDDLLEQISQEEQQLEKSQGCQQQMTQNVTKPVLQSQQSKQSCTSAQKQLRSLTALYKKHAVKNSSAKKEYQRSIEVERQVTQSNNEEEQLITKYIAKSKLVEVEINSIESQLQLKRSLIEKNNEENDALTKRVEGIDTAVAQMLNN